MNRNQRSLLLFVAVSAFAAMATIDAKDGDILQQKEELEEIQSDVQKGRDRLDSLRKVESSVQKNIGNYDQKIATNKKVVGRLNRELRQLKADIASGEQQLESNQTDLDRIRRRYLGNIRQLYLATRTSQTDAVDRPNTELELHREVVYLTALSGFESGNVLQATALLDRSLVQLEELSGQKAHVSTLKRKKETSTSLERSKKKKQERALQKLRRQKTEESDRLMTLEQAAREMGEIIDRLERERARRRTAGSKLRGPSQFAGLKGQLSAPCRGKVTVAFGNSVDPVTHLKSFSPGITIRGKAGRSVTTVGAGTVAYVGSLRGYGSFVIINHDDYYYTTYAGLKKSMVSEGQYLLAGDPLARAGDDGLVKFELRLGREPLDPVKWIRIDSF